MVISLKIFKTLMTVLFQCPCSTVGIIISNSLLRNWRFKIAGVKVTNLFWFPNIKYPYRI